MPTGAILKKPLAIIYKPFVLHPQAYQFLLRVFLYKPYEQNVMYVYIYRFVKLPLCHSPILQGVFTFLYISVLSHLGERFAVRLRTALFHSIIQQDIAFFDSHKTGELVNR